MPSSRISLEKTEYIIGKKVDVGNDAEDSDDEEGTMGEASGLRATRDYNSPSLKQIRMMQEVLSTQAKSFIELEKLVVTLDTLQSWRLIMDEKIQFVVPLI
jgi:hypothetical protein